MAESKDFEKVFRELVEAHAPKEQTHILHQGSPVCHFSTERPQDWPKGHYWISVDAFVNGAGISCADCAQNFFVMTGRKNPYV